MIGHTPTATASFQRLILPHLDSAYSLARYLSRDAGAAEDIAHDAMLKAFRAFDGFRGGDGKAWLLAIVRNAHLDWARKSKGWRMLTAEAGDIDILTELADPDQITAEAGLIAQADVATVRAGIEALAEPFREAVVLRDLEALSYREIALATGVAIGTVMSRLARGRALLARHLTPLREDSL